MKNMCIDSILESSKEIMWLIVSAIVSVFAPVQNILLLLFWAFLFNIIVGIIADVNVNKKRFDLKKAFTAISQLLFYFACIIFLSHGAELLGDEKIGTLGVKWVTCIVSYFYLTNIFRNASQLFPKNEAVKFIYELLSTEIFNRLKEMLGFKTNGNDKK